MGSLKSSATQRALIRPAPQGEMWTARGECGLRIPSNIDFRRAGTRTLVLCIEAKAFRADQADPRQAKSLIDSVMAEFGSLDILVNNAGTVAYGAIDIPATDLAALDKLIAVLFTA